MLLSRRHPRAQEHFFPQIWLLMISVVAFAGFVAVDQSYLSMMLAADRSHLSLLITAIFLGASCHAAWHIFATSGRLRAARALLVEDATGLEGAADQAVRYFSDFLAELDAAAGEARAKEKESDDGILEIYADQLRSPVEIGWFIVDVLIRLGLVGTIIGFILMLASLAEGPTPDTEDIRTLLIAMSGGMGTALYTTLAGLVTATLLGIQYMILGRSVEHLVAALIRIERRRPAPAA